MASEKSPPDMEKVMEFAHKVVGDLSAAISGPLVYIGDKFGLFRILSQEGPMTMHQLAEKTGLQERYLHEWASAMTAAEYLDYEPKAKAFSLNEAQALVLATEGSPVFVQGFFQMIPDHYGKIPQIMQAMKDGGGIPYSEYTEDTFEGTERFFKGGYLNFLVQEWLPATGYEEKLKKGAKVADVGCGRGVAIVTMAKAFPNSKFYGFDNYRPGLKAAREKAREAGVENAFFEEVASTELPQSHDFDLICNFDSLHDMIDPEGCAQSIHGALKDDGAWMVVEPNVSDHLEENVNPLGRAFYSISMLQCMTASLAHGGKAYGACMGQGKLKEISEQAGFKSLKRLPIENPFNAIALAQA